MTDLEKALADIDAIKTQLARETTFRGYGPATVALTGLIAITAAVAQAAWIVDPAEQWGAYVALWVAAALAGAALVGAEAVTRSRRLHSALADEMIFSALAQFAPAGLAGGLTTAVLARFAPESVWMLPGLWQIFFALGIFSSCRLLPEATTVTAAWYMACGLACLALASGTWTFSPWAMGVPFGVGQLLFAAILYRTLGGYDGED